MAVVIRLQGLRITAGSQDIRKFFTGLKIPDGGVHIIGGEREEAFIIFASDEDARRAMTRSGGVIKGGHVTLLLSSKAEMQSVLESSTKNVAQEPESPLEEDPGRPRRPVEDEQMSRRPGMRSDHVPPAWHQTGSNSDDLYVFLNGLPFSVTEKEICDFFSGLLIDDIVLVKNEKGLNNGRGFVRFSSSEDAQEGLKRDREYIGSRYVEVYSTTEADWRRAAGANTSRFNRGGSPFRSQRNSQHHIRSRSPITLRPAASSGDDYCVLLENLAFTVEKNDIKRLFRHANLEDDQILYLNQDDGRRTKSAFVLFKTVQEYRDAVACDKRPFFNRLIHVRPISREKMIALLGSESMDARSTRNPDRFQDRPPSYPRDSYESEKMCLFVQNLPFDVRKVEIMDFFLGFSITEDDVVLLRDNAGAGIGKALVVFSSEAAAMRALSLSGQRFLGSEVALKCISRSQMQEFGVEPPGPQGPGDDDFPDKSSEESFHPVDPKGPDFRVPSNRNMPMSNTQAPNYRDSDYETFADDSHTPEDGGNGYGPLGRFDGPSRQRFEGPSGRFDGPSGHRFCGASRQRFDGPSGHRFGGPTGQRFDGPSGQRFDSPSRHRFDGPSGQRFDGPSGQRFDGPTCVKLHNLPFQIRIEEIYDFCYGFQIIPGSASLQYDKSGAPQGTATVVFESRQEAFMAIEELSGRPIGPRKIQLVFV